MKIIKIVLFSIFLGMLSGCSNTTSKATEGYYTCSMHPQIHKEEPGSCPMCGMNLVLINPTAVSSETAIDSALKYLVQPVTQTAIGHFKTTQLQHGHSSPAITTTGILAFDQRYLHRITLRTAGRIEKLYIKNTYQRVRKGAPLMKIYSQKMVSIQQNLLTAQAQQSETMVHSLSQQLLNLGMSKGEIDAVLRQNKVKKSITIYSPYSGIIQSIKNKQLGNPQPLNIKEGMYVKSGESLFAIQNTSKIWAVLDVFTADLMRIKREDKVLLIAQGKSKDTVQATIDFIPPDRENGEKTTSVRVYLDKIPQNWKIGTFLQGEIFPQIKEKGWFLPAESVLTLGKRAVVWVQHPKEPDVFQVREVEVGFSTTDKVEVLAGLESTEKVALNASFMIENESIIHE